MQLLMQLKVKKLKRKLPFLRIIEEKGYIRKKYVIFTYFFCFKSIVNDEFYCYYYYE